MVKKISLVLLLSGFVAASSSFATSFKIFDLGKTANLANLKGGAEMCKMYFPAYKCCIPVGNNASNARLKFDYDNQSTVVDPGFGAVYVIPNKSPCPSSYDKGVQIQVTNLETSKVVPSPLALPFVGILCSGTSCSAWK